jgi:Rrf2 family protein
MQRLSLLPCAFMAGFPRRGLFLTSFRGRPFALLLARGPVRFVETCLLAYDPSVTLSRRGKYALRALLYLARHREQGPILIHQIAQEERIPKKFLEAILLELKNNGILASRKGKGGGYYFERDPSSVFVGQVIRMLDGPLAPVRCLSQTALARCEDCPEEASCVLRSVMAEVHEAVTRILDHLSLQDLLEREENLRLASAAIPTFDI